MGDNADDASRWLEQGREIFVETPGHVDARRIWSVHRAVRVAGSAGKTAAECPSWAGAGADM